MNRNKEFYYLVGALRDGCLSTEWTIVYVQKNRRWLSDVIIPRLNDIFGTSLNPTKIYWQDGAWRVKFKNKRIWKILKRFYDTIPDDIQCRNSYIRGFWDADGGCPRKPRKNGRLYIKFTQKENKILGKIKYVLEKNFGIQCGSVIVSDIKKNGIVWRFSIENKAGILNFCKLIGSLHPEKKARLEKIKLLLAG